MVHAGYARYCRCCGSRVKGFRPAGPRRRPDAECPVCGSLERDRLVSLYFERHPELLAAADRVLHVSPERPITHLLLRRGGVDYVSIDAEPGAAMRTMDLTELEFRDGRFDAVYCSNVLEHVPMDRAAMREIYRVLRPGGWAVILVPLHGDRTEEDLSITDPGERTRLYGQPDHVRSYGMDVMARLAAAGFELRAERPGRVLTNTQARYEGINRDEVIFVCRRPDAVSPARKGEVLRHTAHAEGRAVRSVAARSSG